MGLDEWSRDVQLNLCSVGAADPLRKVLAAYLCSLIAALSIP